MLLLLLLFLQEPPSDAASPLELGVKLIIVGDALMAPWELMSVSGWQEDEGVEGAR